ncbi:MAG TPA: Wzz/FepE/Etk N-terminal domain-containing protein, partial [Candidatus Dormibacteraeota bacterium]|nr:Wzz/FepE/Etk N-terminal domain-containing protein [Candidatus Dormibacteraeota bacterium]
LRQFLRALRARFGIFVMTLVTMVVAAIVASLLMTPTYRATVSLLVDIKNQQSMVETLQALGLPQEHQSYLQTQADILSSPKVARRVVQQLGLARDPVDMATLGITKPGSPRVEDRLVERLLQGLKVETSQSDVILATFTCSDARLAATVANAFATAYTDTMLELHVAPSRQASAWFDQQLAALRSNLEDAQRKLRANLELEQRQLARHPERLPVARNDAYLGQLRADLLRGEEHLRELSTRYGPNYPDYQRQVAQNQELRAKLREEMGDMSTAVANPDGGRSQRYAGEPSDPEQAKLLEPILQHNVDSAEKAYDTALQRYLASQVDSHASQANTAVLSPATIPLRAARPNLPLNIVLSLFTGLALGCALVALAERGDGRVRSIEDLTAAVDLPLLAVLSNDGRSVGLLPQPAGPALRALPRPG